jgi:hypothetical protein
MKTTPRHVKDTIERVYRPGLTATIDKVHKTIGIEFHRTNIETYLLALTLVEEYAKKGYENI